MWQRRLFFLPGCVWKQGWREKSKQFSSRRHVTIPKVHTDGEPQAGAVNLIGPTGFCPVTFRVCPSENELRLAYSPDRVTGWGAFYHYEKYI